MTNVKGLSLYLIYVSSKNYIDFKVKETGLKELEFLHINVLI